MPAAPHARLTIPLALALSLAARGAAAQPVVRAGHPRIWLSADGRRGLSVEALRARCEATGQVWARGCRAGAPPPNPTATMPVRNAEHSLINLALRYLLYEEPSVLDIVRQEVVRVGGFGDRQDPLGQLVADAAAVRSLAVSYDWLYNALSPADRASFVTPLRDWGNWLLANPPQDVFASESYVHVSLLGLVGLALSNDAETAADGTRFLRAADERWKSALLPALAVTRDWWPEGAGTLTNLAARNALYLATAWSTATNEDLFAVTRTRGGDVFNHWARYLSYWLRPDLRWAPFGDAYERQHNPAGSLRPMLDMLAWGTGSPLAHHLSDEVTRRLAVASDYNGPEAWHLVVFYDPLRPQREGRSTLPLAAHLGAGTGDAVVFRSSWDDASATWISMTCGDWFTTRQHLDVGAIQVHRRAPLVTSTGIYDGFETQHWLGWLAQRSVHASTLSVFNPMEVFPSGRLSRPINDGGQRALDYTNLAARRSVDAWRMNLTAGAQYETGSVTAFESAQFHDYAACDATRAYNSERFTAAPNAPKVREVSRQLVYLRPDVLVVFDRVEATDPRFEKRFALHALSRPVLQQDGAFVIQRNGGRLIGRTLYPPDPRRALVDGFRVGTEELPTLSESGEGIGTRIEVTHPVVAQREYFLHVLHVADTSSPAPPPVTLVEDRDTLGLRMTDPESGQTTTLSFDRSNAMGGTLRVTTGDGQVRYAGRLGMGGVVYPATADAGPVALDGGAETTADGGVSSPTEPGCSCRAGAPRASLPSWALGLALALLRRRRRD